VCYATSPRANTCLEGGAVNSAQNSEVEITRSEFSYTAAKRLGGAIFSAATLFIESSSFNANIGQVLDCLFRTKVLVYV
jgi:hypothetical protein